MVKLLLRYKSGRRQRLRPVPTRLVLECGCGERFTAFHSEQLERALVKHIEACHPWAE
jgi:hypothetical protein